MKRKPLPIQKFPAFPMVFAIYAVSFCFMPNVDAASSRRIQRNSTLEPGGSGSPEIFTISEISTRKEILVDVGETVYIGCALNRTNADGCEWYKKNPQDGSKIRITQFFDRYQKINSCQLQIRSITYEDEGTIICKAIGDSSEPIYYTNHITVSDLDDPSENILPKPMTDNRHPSLSYAAPEIQKDTFTEDRIYKVHKGGNIVVQCLATGSPKPLVSWRRGSKNYTELTEGYSNLKLTNLTKDDSGVYKCEAINIFGRVVYDITIEVRGALQGASEIIDVTPRNVTLYEGSQGNITCIARFEGDPWFVWVKKIENKTPDINAFSYEGQFYSVLQRTEYRPLGQHLYATTLLLQNVTVGNSGVYHCIVAGLQGYNHSEAYVVVEKDPAHLHIAQIRKHKTVAILWIFSFVIFAGLVVLCIVRIYGCPNAATNKMLRSHVSLPSDTSTSRKTQLPKRSPETLSTDCTNPRHEVFVPLVTHGSCSLASQEPSIFYKECSSSCRTYNSYDSEFSLASNSGDSFIMANLEVARSSCSQNVESCNSEACSQQSVTSPRTQTSDYYTTRQHRGNNYRGRHTNSQHHKHRHQHHHLYPVASEKSPEQVLHYHPQTEALNHCSCTEDYCSCQNTSYEDYPRSTSNLSLSSDCESQWYPDPPPKSAQYRYPYDVERRYGLEDDDSRRSVAVNERRKLNPSPNLSFLEQLKANPNSVTAIL